MPEVQLSGVRRVSVGTDCPEGYEVVGINGRQQICIRICDNPTFETIRNGGINVTGIRSQEETFTAGTGEVREGRESGVGVGTSTTYFLIYEDVTP